MKVIEITETKLDKMTGCVEEMLRIGGKLMTCLEDMEEGGKYGERYGNRMGYRDAEMYEDTPAMMGERYGERYGQRGRRRDSMGRYM